MHVGDDFETVSELALGVTSCRNPGGPIELEVSQRERRNKARCWRPNASTRSSSTRRGRWWRRAASPCRSLDETLAAVRKIKANNLTAVKFYTSMKPAWIAPGAKLAHELGLHVHGHIPAGMRTLDAINAGYDEITHIYFATMQAMPQEVVDKSNTTMRMLGPGKYFKDVDLDAEPTKTVIRTMAEKKIVLDPTLVVVEGVLLANAGTVAPAYVPYVGTLPAATERGFKSGPIPYLPGHDPRRRATSFAAHGRICDEAAQRRRADRRRHRRHGHGAGARAGALRRGRHDPRPRRWRPQRSRRRATSRPTAVPVDRGRQGSRSAAGRRRPRGEHRRSSPRRPGDERRRAVDGDALREAAGFSGKPK